MQLKAEKINAGYEEKLILQDVSLKAEAGELIAIAGPNGSGKSTLLKTIAGILPPLGGKIKLDGRDISSLSLQQLAQRMAYLPQENKLDFGYTAEEVVLLGRAPYLSWWQQESRQDKELAAECLRCMGVDRYRDYPLNKLSGGQKQRVWLAKILAQQTPVILLDEPAAGLDFIYREKIYRFCQSLCRRGRLVMLVGHDLSLVSKYCSRILFVAGGRVLADGEPRQVMTSQLLTEVYGEEIAVRQDRETGTFSFEVKAKELGQDDLLRKILARGKDDE